ncbi:MAG: hypothetical protein ACR2LM_07955 [Pyrinomonadaceae bacterium]
MRLRDFLIAATMMSFALTTVLAKPSPALIRSPDSEYHSRAGDAVGSVPLPPPVLISRDKVLESAYYNTLAILSRSNRCSDFFGSPTASMDVFNRFVSQVRKDYISSSIAMRMHGPTISGQDARTSTRYRLFSKVSINANGPFYKRGDSRSERTVLGIGNFRPNTHEVRVLILLHELGHLMKGQDGKWLLPDDGRNERLSLANSRKIEEVCGEQIKGLGDGDALRNLARWNQPDEELALDGNNPVSH